MKKYVGLLIIILGSYLIYDQIYSAKFNMESTLSDFRKNFSQPNLSIVDLKNRTSEYEDIADKYCNSSSIQNANLFMIDELLNVASSDTSQLGSFLKANPIISNSANYSREFIIYYKLARMFDSTLEQVKLEYSKSAEMMAFRAETDKAMSKPLSSKDFTTEEYENINQVFTSSLCGLAKMHLGLIGKDSDFVQNIKAIQSEIAVKNIQEANQALQQIERSLGN